jgi:hypothetical protein
MNEYVRSAKKRTGSVDGTVTRLRAGRPGFLSPEAKGSEFQADHTHTHTHTHTLTHTPTHTHTTTTT